LGGRLLVKIVYLLVRRILHLVVLLFRRDMAKDAERRRGHLLRLVARRRYPFRCPGLRVVISSARR